MNRHSFYWWVDAMWAARSIASRTGVRQRVTKSVGPRGFWSVSPAVVRGPVVEVTC